MPRAIWRGFLRLSLVSCPIYLSPATTRTKPLRLHQVWRPAPAEEADDAPPLAKGQELLSRKINGLDVLNEIATPENWRKPLGFSLARTRARP